MQLSKRMMRIVPFAFGGMVAALPQPARAWSGPWLSMGGSFISYDATFRQSGGSSIYDVYGVDVNDASVSVSSAVYSFTGWHNLGGVVAASQSNQPRVSAIAIGGHREFFVIGTDNALWHQWSDNDTGDNSTWSGWDRIGAPSPGLCSGPSAVSWGPSRIDVLVAGCDNRLWHTWLGQGCTWCAWDEPAPNLGISGNPRAISVQANTLDVFVTDTTNVHGIQDVNWNGSSWQLTNTNLESIRGLVAPAVDRSSVTAFTPWMNLIPNAPLQLVVAEQRNPPNWDNTFPPGPRYTDIWWQRAVTEVSGSHPEVFYTVSQSSTDTAHVASAIWDGSWTDTSDFGGEPAAGFSKSSEPVPVLAQGNIFVYMIDLNYQLWVNTTQQ
jgi:hypothetical protein